jgi:hypothetical protein
MPDTFVDFRKQRFRWAYGAMQILRRHARALFARNTQLSTGQRYHFIAGWLPWLADGLNLAFNIAALCWSVAMILAPHRIDPPLVMFSMLPIGLFTFKLIKLAHLYVSRVGANLRQTLAAAIAGLALSHTIGKAVIKGLFADGEPFFRTPKDTQPHALTRGLAGAAGETCFLMLLLVAVYLLTHQVSLGADTLGVPAELRGSDLSIWVAVLMIQSVPYAAALLVSLVSVLPLPSRWLGPAAGTQVPSTAQASSDP